MALDPAVTLQPQQARLRSDAARAFAAGEPFRRLVVWSVGSGKTTGALAAADALGGGSVVAPAAVRPGFRQEAARVLGDPAYDVRSYQQAARQPEFRPPTLVVDEAQRLGSPGSAQARAVLDAARAAKNVMLLTGTPVRNHPREAAPLIEALTGTPLSHDDFDRRFVGTERVRPGGLLGWFRGLPAVEQPTLKNVDELRRMLAGRVDYYESTTPSPGAPESVRYEDVEAELLPGQARLYEAMMGRLPWALRFKLRWNYPLSDEELARTRSFMTGPRQVALSDYPYHPSRDPLRAFDNSGKLRTAFARLQTRLADPRAKGIVYSNFPDAGLVPYAAALAKAGVPHAIFHGGLTDPERKALVADFNAGRTRVALVGPAGAEGISLKGSQLIQLLDNHWNQARSDQAQARGIRFDSHLGLPADLRDVTVERYTAKLPLGVKDRVLARLGLVDPGPRRATVDDYLRNLADSKQRLNDQFVAVLREVAAHNRTAKTAADRVHAGDAVRLARLADAAAARGVEKVAAALAATVYAAGGAGRREAAGGPAPPPTDLQTLPLQDRLRLAKVYSDMGTPEGYATKTTILRAAIREAPGDWYVDSDQGHTLGVTHVTGWRYHLPASKLGDLLPLMARPPAARAPRA